MRIVPKEKMPRAASTSTDPDSKRRGRNTDRPKLQGSEKRAQATLMMTRRLFGDATLKQLGEEFHMDPRTVQRRLALARTDGVPDAAREVFIRDMLPQSMAVLQEALTGDDLRTAVMVALKVIEGLRAMDAPAAEAIAGQMEVTLEEWKASRVVRRIGIAPGESAAGTIDATVIPDTPLAAAEAVGPPQASGSGPQTVQLQPGTGVADLSPDAAAEANPADAGSAGSETGVQGWGRHD